MNKYSSLVHHEAVFKKSPIPASWLLGAIWAPALEGTAQSPLELSARLPQAVSTHRQTAKMEHIKCAEGKCPDIPLTQA